MGYGHGYTSTRFATSGTSPARGSGANTRSGRPTTRARPRCGRCLSRSRAYRSWADNGYGTRSRTVSAKRSCARASGSGLPPSTSGYGQSFTLPTPYGGTATKGTRRWTDCFRTRPTEHRRRYTTRYFSTPAPTTGTRARRRSWRWWTGRTGTTGHSDNVNDYNDRGGLGDRDDLGDRGGRDGYGHGGDGGD